MLNTVALKTSVGLLEETVKLGRISDGLVGEWRWGGVEEAVLGACRCVGGVSIVLNNIDQHHGVVVRQGK